MLDLMFCRMNVDLTQKDPRSVSVFPKRRRTWDMSTQYLF